MHKTQTSNSNKIPSLKLIRSRKMSNKKMRKLKNKKINSKSKSKSKKLKLHKPVTKIFRIANSSRQASNG